jgi:lipopolysaccharide biosynthesis regulator YciM
MPQAKAAALKALELDPTLGEAHISLALVQFLFDWDWAGARSSFQNALRFSPNYATAYHAYSAFLACSGDIEQGIREAQHALTLDPLSIPIHNILGELYMFNRDWARAATQYEKAVEMDTGVSLPHENLAIVLEETGRYPEAVDQYLMAWAAAGEKEDVLRLLRETYASSGLAGFWQKLLEIVLTRWSNWHADAFRIASIYARLGQDESAIEWLQRGFEARSGAMVWIKLYPWFGRLARYPRFREVTRQIGLPE